MVAKHFKKGVVLLVALVTAGSALAEDKTATKPATKPTVAYPWGYAPPPVYGYGPWGGMPYGYLPPVYGYLPPPVYGPWGYGAPPAWGYGQPFGGMTQAARQPRINQAVLNELKGKLGVRANQESYWNDLAKELLKLKPEENPLKSQPVLAAYERLRSVLDEKQRALADGFKNSLIW
ncbi:MAG: DUF2288 domain-containing protein [Magnetococcales bacterium]|nr:hypothetical protein [Magnetococcales bacterium]NGZ27838.1 DUF2288 domain-containing protein [Magnetococcales bacterium]